MGVGPVAYQLYRKLLDTAQMRPGMSVCELGAQDCGGLPPPHNIVISSRDLMKQLGFGHFDCIDLDGRHGAFKLNLNTAKVADVGRRYDIVTNHGTTEHVFDQANCLRLIHDLTKVNGLIIHVVPGQGYPSHCFYRYDHNLFRDLATANNYDVISSYDETDYITDPAGGCVLAIAVLRRTSPAEFVVPIEQQYRSTCLLT